MEKESICIEAPCRYFACRECRTKVGWRHQAWCPCRGQAACSCADCLYYREKKRVCAHPAFKKEGRNGREKAEYPV